MPTRLNPALLATRQTTQRLDERLALRRLRVALMQILTGARPKPSHAWDDVARDEPRTDLPCAKERAMIHAAIHQGKTTPERVTAYRLAQLTDDLSQFESAPLMEELIYLTLTCEQLQSIDAVSHVHLQPTEDNIERALRETREAVTMGQMACAFLEQRRPLRHAVPMGVSR